MQKSLLFITALFFTTSAFAQTTVPTTPGDGGNQKFRLGAELTPHVSWISTDDKNVVGSGANVGIRVGLFGEYYFAENYALSFGLGYGINHGSTLTYTQGGDVLHDTKLSNFTTVQSFAPGVRVNYHTNYLELPFSFKLRTDEINYMRYFVQIPQFTIAVRTDGTADIEGAYADKPNNTFTLTGESISNSTNFLNIRWGIGAGMEYALTKKVTAVGAFFFNSDLLDITPSGTRLDNTVEGSVAKTANIGLRVGVMF